MCTVAHVPQLEAQREAQREAQIRLTFPWLLPTLIRDLFLFALHFFTKKRMPIMQSITGGQRHPAQ